MIKAVLFDLDDTLLSLNLTAFVARYVWGVSSLLAQIARTDAVRLAVPYGQGLLELDANRREDDLTNEGIFNERFLLRTQIPLDDPAIADALRCFEREVVPQMGAGVVRATPKAGAREAVERTWDLGLICALATNPTFSLGADLARLRWAGLSPTDFAAISTWSNSRRVKPDIRYYQEFAQGLGLTLRECLMVGNDSRRDLPLESCGLRTLYVGHARPSRAAWCGSMSELARELPEIVGRLNEQDEGGPGAGSREGLR